MTEEQYTERYIFKDKKDQVYDKLKEEYLNLNKCRRYMNDYEVILDRLSFEVQKEVQKSKESKNSMAEKICKNCKFLLTTTTTDHYTWYECLLAYPECADVKLTDTCSKWKPVVEE